MTTENDTTLRASDAVFAAEQAIGRARRVVGELHDTISSAVRVLDDAELDSAKARLSDHAQAPMALKLSSPSWRSGNSGCTPLAKYGSWSAATSSRYIVPKA